MPKLLRSRLPGLPALLAAAVCALGSAQSFAQSAPTRGFTALTGHNPSAASYALRYGADVVTREKGQFRIYLTHPRSVLMFVPAYRQAALVHREYREIHARVPRLEVIACGDAVEAIKKALKVPRVPVLPGVRIESCKKGLNRQLLADGWSRMMGV